MLLYHRAPNLATSQVAGVSLQWMRRGIPLYGDVFGLTMEQEEDELVRSLAFDLLKAVICCLCCIL